MKYDFTTVIDRRGKDALAVDGLGTIPGVAPMPPKDGFDAIPMWVADMNFATVPTVPEALVERAQHALYGYYQYPEEYFASIINWQEKRNGVTGKYGFDYEKNADGEFELVRYGDGVDSGDL